MYEMRAEHDPAVDERPLLWHVIAKDDNARSLCGRVLQAGQPVPIPVLADGDGSADRYCGPCLTVVREAMAVAVTGP